eukprot:TRINITY_DN3471_c1_g1_i4.p1 TRINITY_DN3471_c1_g1~~TRINITY_DN3471_c1_g1_i4.p1  ORF type:complete len:415 (+),score=83.65 TRINITY_DN3471_c1_g1_i4:177-1421(+)
MKHLFLVILLWKEAVIFASGLEALRSRSEFGFLQRPIHALEATPVTPSGKATLKQFVDGGKGQDDEALASMAASMLSKLIQGTPSDLVSLKLQIGEMQADVTTQHKYVQSQLNNMSDYEACDAAETDALADVGYRNAATTTASPEQKITQGEIEACIDEVQSLNRTRHGCIATVSSLGDAADEACKRLEDVRKTKPMEAVEEACSMNAGSYEEYLTHYANKLDDLQGRHAACKTAMAAQSAKGDECESLTQKLYDRAEHCENLNGGKIPKVRGVMAMPEPALCNQYHYKAAVCTTSLACRDQVKKRKLQEFKEQQDLEKDRKAEWQMLEKLSCVADATQDPSDLPETLINKCMESNRDDYKTNHLDLVIPREPEAKKCDPGPLPHGCSWSMQVVSADAGEQTQSPAAAAGLTIV